MNIKSFTQYINWDLLGARKELIIGALLAALPLIINTGIPAKEHLFILLSASLFYMYQSHEKIHYKMHIILSYTFSFILYSMLISTTSLWLYESASHLTVIWISYALTSYYLSKEHTQYVYHFVQRLVTTLIAFGYGITIHLIIYLLTFFSSAIFDLQISAFSLFNYALSLSIFAFYLTLFSAPIKKDYIIGKFYHTLFGIIVPYFSLLCGILAIIYLIQMLFGFRPDTVFLTTYYPYIVIFYIFYMFHTLCHTKKWISKSLLLLFISLTIIALLFITKRQFSDISQQISSFYAIVCNIAFLFYNVYLYRKNLSITAHFTKLILLIIGITFFPLFGYWSYVENVTYTQTDAGKKTTYNLSALLQKNKTLSELDRTIGETSPYTHDNIDKYNHHLSFSSKSNFNVDVKNFSRFYIGNALSSANPINKQSSLTLSVDQEFKVLTIIDERNPKAKDVFYIFEAVQQFTKQHNHKPHQDAPIMIDGTHYRIYLHEFDWKSPNQDNNIVRFFLLEK